MHRLAITALTIVTALTALACKSRADREHEQQEQGLFTPKMFEQMVQSDDGGNRTVASPVTSMADAGTKVP